jgi:hypothetical protein
LYISIAVLIAATAVQTELDKQIQAGELMVLPEYA